MLCGKGQCGNTAGGDPDIAGSRECCAAKGSVVNTAERDPDIAGHVSAVRQRAVW